MKAKRIFNINVDGLPLTKENLSGGAAVAIEFETVADRDVFMGVMKKTHIKSLVQAIDGEPFVVIGSWSRSGWGAIPATSGHLSISFGDHTSTGMFDKSSREDAQMFLDALELTWGPSEWNTLYEFTPNQDCRTPEFGHIPTWGTLIFNPNLYNAAILNLGDQLLAKKAADAAIVAQKEEEEAAAERLKEQQEEERVAAEIRMKQKESDLDSLEQRLQDKQRDLEERELRANNQIEELNRKEKELEQREEDIKVQELALHQQFDELNMKEKELALMAEHLIAKENDLASQIPPTQLAHEYHNDLMGIDASEVSPSE